MFSVRAHLAIPVRNLVKDADFYRSLGARLIASTPTSAVMNFYDMQLVLHLSDECVPDDKVKMYPRHFGIIFPYRKAWMKARRAAKRLDCVWHKDFIRNIGTNREHETFFAKDLSNNLIEFKWYRRVAM